MRKIRKDGVMIVSPDMIVTDDEANIVRPVSVGISAKDAEKTDAFRDFCMLKPTWKNGVCEEPACDRVKEQKPCLRHEVMIVLGKPI